MHPYSRGDVTPPSGAAPVALVTGSSSGIGAAVVKRMAAAGMRIVVNSATSVTAGEKLAASLPQAIYVQGDVSVHEDTVRLVGAAISEFGHLDILVNNASTTRFVPLHDLAAANAEIWREILAVNVIGTWQMTAAASPYLKAAGAGAVVNITSQAGVTANGSCVPYAVSKAAVNHMTRLLARVVGPEIRVNAVAPGLIDTPWYSSPAGQDYFHQARKHIEASAPLRRIGTAEDVAEAVFALATAPYISGEVLLVNGGGHLV
ncbi:SDR family NAD(P)-dependent oxidoreductase [Streptomyces blastmyceticus]|uniref:SDR family NAD(P)-dependent oxidoreductase n=1 Tax=Streptomyces blastmyceticus TaxID=68180 RepID=A0ABN0X8A4_9ACTN